MVYLALPCVAEQTETVEAAAEETSAMTTSAPSTGFVSDELFVFTHAGAGKNYRILGRLAAGSEVKLTGNQANDFSQIIDDRKRAVWIENQYLSKTPGLRFAIADLNGRHASLTERNEMLMAELAEAKLQNTAVEKQLATLQKSSEETQKLLTDTKAKLRDEDTNIKKQWFYNGAAVLSIGLVLGLILPRLAGRKRNSANSWT